MIISREIAAYWLNVSVEYVDILQTEGVLLTTVMSDGTEGIDRTALFEYKAKRDTERDVALNELVRMTEEFGGYRELERSSVSSDAYNEWLTRVREQPDE